MTEWRRRTWLITGASSGFGRALVEAVIADGGRVAAFSRDPSPLEEVRERSSGRLRLCAVDITDHSAAARLVTSLEDDFGGVDVLANNAGYGLLGGIEETDEAQVREIFEVNFFAAEALTRAVLPGMRRRRSGFVVNFSSVSGVRGIPGSGYYAATKFALEGLSEALRRECASLGIGVMIVEPGPFRTGFLHVSRKHASSRIPEYEAVERRREAESNYRDGIMQDPARGVVAILDAMQADDPPERLALGGYAVKLIGQAYEERLEELRRWADLARAVDTPPSGNDGTR